MRKSCPVRSNGCYKDKCAWWDELSQKCAVLLLAQRFDAVTSTDDRLLVDTPEEYCYDEASHR